MDRYDLAERIAVDLEKEELATATEELICVIYTTVNKYVDNDCNAYEKAIKQWGEPLQKAIAIEEMAELTKALIKNLRGKASNVEEEIADVKIMIRQLEKMFNKEAIDEWEKAKIERLEKILDAEGAE